MSRPPILVNVPPTYSLPAEVASARTVLLLLIPVVQDGSTPPVTAFTAASRLRAELPALVKAPPRKMVLPSSEAARAYTMPLTSGFQDGSTLPSARIAAALSRGRPLSMEKAPPTSTREPETATVFTASSALGSQPVNPPVPVVNAAARIRCWPPASVKTPPA